MNLPTPRGQCAILLDHLKHSAITHREAVKLYQIMGFLARISELRAMGYHIKDRYVTSPTTGARYKVYHLDRGQPCT